MARDLEGIRDRLTVEQGWRDYHVVALWHGGAQRAIGSFRNEDDAWGVVSLILQYVDAGYNEETACDRAMREYRELLTNEDDDQARYIDLMTTVGPELTLVDAAYQDHAAEMRVWA
jgi:hypothetical protein